MNQWDQVKVAAAIIESGAREAMLSADCVEDKFRAAFKEAREYWMSTDDDIRFRGGIGAVMINIGTDHPEYHRIEIELELLKNLNAMLSGLSVNPPEVPENHEPIGIAKLWREES